MQKKVLTIIVSYNFEKWIHQCIPSLLHSSYPTDIIVIDNASKDNTVNIIKENYPSVLLIESNENHGFGKANNIGIAHALANDYDYVFLVNQDAWVEKECIENLMINEAPNDALLSPMHYDGTEKSLDKGFAEYCKDISFDKNIQQVKFVNAAFWWIPLDIIRRVGTFSPIFYHYGEDKDFANRLEFHKIPMYVVKNAIAYHDRQHRTEPKINFKGEFVFHLTEFCNINYSLLKAFAKAVLAPCKKAAKHLFKGRLDVSLKYIQLSIKLLYKFAEVQQTRAKNRVIGSQIQS